MSVVLYSDLNADSTTTASSLVEGLDAVDQAVINICSTAPAERCFNLEISADFEDLLFELIGPDTAAAIYSKITTTLLRYEPRIEINHQLSSIEPNYELDGYDVLLAYYVKGYGTTRGLKTFLQRRG